MEASTPLCLQRKDALLKSVVIEWWTWRSHRQRRESGLCPLYTSYSASFLFPLAIKYIPTTPMQPTHLSCQDPHILMVTTRTKSYSQHARARAHESIRPVLETLSDRRRRWSHMLRSHQFQPLIEEVLNEELPKYENSAIIDVEERVLHMRECAHMLASAPSVFAAAVHGNLAEQILSDTELQREYATIQERAHHQPSIYIHMLADERGIAPTLNQYLIIRSIMLDYMAEGQASEHAWHLDSITPSRVTKEASAQGHRKYIHTTKRSLQRIEILRQFCQGIQNRWLETDMVARDTPFQFPPGECGYSKDSHTRLAQHRAYQSSSYVMNLVEDICTYLHRTGQFEQQFQMYQFIIYLIFRTNQAAVAEIFCSGLLQVWVENGGGFNAYPAGRSVATARRVSTSEWNAHEKWARQASHVIENMKALQESADEWRKALEWEGDLSEGSAMTTGSANEDEDRYECF